MFYFLLIVLILALDRIVKLAVTSNMIPGESLPILENIFHITYVRNSGAAFNIMSGQTIFLIGMPLLILSVGIVVLILKRKSWHSMLNCAVALVISGGAGNLIDRAINGYVVDMFDFRVFPVFNVADISVCVGCGLALLYFIAIDGKADKDRNGR